MSKVYPNELEYLLDETIRQKLDKEFNDDWEKKIRLEIEKAIAEPPPANFYNRAKRYYTDFSPFKFIENDITHRMDAAFLALQSDLKVSLIPSANFDKISKSLEKDWEDPIIRSKISFALNKIVKLSIDKYTEKTQKEMDSFLKKNGNPMDVLNITNDDLKKIEDDPKVKTFEGHYMLKESQKDNLLFELIAKKKQEARDIINSKYPLENRISEGFKSEISKLEQASEYLFKFTEKCVELKKKELSQIQNKDTVKPDVLPTKLTDQIEVKIDADKKRAVANSSAVVPGAKGKVGLTLDSIISYIQTPYKYFKTKSEDIKGYLEGVIDKSDAKKDYYSRRDDMNAQDLNLRVEIFRKLKKLKDDKMDFIDLELSSDDANKIINTDPNRNTLTGLQNAINKEMNYQDLNSLTWEVIKMNTKYQKLHGDNFENQKNLMTLSSEINNKIKSNEFNEQDVVNFKASLEKISRDIEKHYRDLKQKGSDTLAAEPSVLESEFKLTNEAHKQLDELYKRALSLRDNYKLNNNDQLQIIILTLNPSDRPKLVITDKDIKNINISLERWELAEAQKIGVELTTATQSDAKLKIVTADLTQSLDAVKAKSKNASKQMTTDKPSALTSAYKEASSSRSQAVVATASIDEKTVKESFKRVDQAIKAQNGLYVGTNLEKSDDENKRIVKVQYQNKKIDEITTTVDPKQNSLTATLSKNSEDTSFLLFADMHKEFGLSMQPCKDPKLVLKVLEAFTLQGGTLKVAPDDIKLFDELPDKDPMKQHYVLVTQNPDKFLEQVKNAKADRKLGSPLEESYLTFRHQ